MLIKELSERTGASIRSLRYYEAKGLLSANRLSNGYRDYDEAAVARVKTIQLYLSLGLTTESIIQIISCPTMPNNNRPVCSEAYQLYKAKVEEIDKQLYILNSVKQRLQEHMKVFEQNMVK